MNQTLEQLQDKPYEEIYTALTELAPQVLEAHERYQALTKQQKLLTGARELITAGLRLGDKVRLHGNWEGKQALVVGAGYAGVLFQLLAKNGTHQGLPLSAFELDGFEKL